MVLFHFLLNLVWSLQLIFTLYYGFGDDMLILLIASRIIIIVDLDLILERSDLIGEPVSAPRTVAVHPSTAQPGTGTGNPQSFPGSSRADS
jgi:hypothetical protein